MPTAMVLRFRDLVGPTIPAHRDIIAKHKYVWWGWWNKPEEKVPRKVFAEFQQEITKKGSIRIYLIDSGSRVLYTAAVTEIRSSPTEDPVSCPEPTRTPEYYNASKYKAWFKFESIEDIPGPADPELRNWSYDEVAEFVDDPAAPIFQDKRVFGAQEMLSRKHRTIYFIKPYSAVDHRDFLAEPLPPINPRNFTNQPIFRNSSYLLHVSDLHFSRDHHGFNVKGGDFLKKTLAASIVDDLRQEYKDVPPAAVIISGDLTWRGEPEEFEWAKSFILTLSSAFNLEIQRDIVVIPGNHDIQWARLADDYDPLSKVEKPPAEAERNYRDFYKDVFGIAPTATLGLGRRYILNNYVAADIIGLNSCRLEQKHFAGYGFVSYDQLRSSAAEMKWEEKKQRSQFRILVLHHHVIPIVASEEITSFNASYSLTLDAAQLVYYALGSSVNLIAHGHMHQPFVSAISRAAKGAQFPQSRTAVIHATGSAGVDKQHLGAIGKNSYSVYDFAEDGVKIRVRSWSENVLAFEHDWESTLSYDGDLGLRKE
jgi:hypothetical protein